jgi:hypothetical protein
MPGEIVMPWVMVLVMSDDLVAPPLVLQSGELASILLHQLGGERRYLYMMPRSWLVYNKFRTFMVPLLQLLQDIR